jgi:hypothetical protein
MLFSYQTRYIMQGIWEGGSAGTSAWGLESHEGACESLKDPIAWAYLLFSYQTGYITWHSRLRIYIPLGGASGNIDPKSGMSHHIRASKRNVPRGIYILSRECHVIYPVW